jgi:hypothetical protein
MGDERSHMRTFDPFFLIQNLRTISDVMQHHVATYSLNCVCAQSKQLLSTHINFRDDM